MLGSSDFFRKWDKNPVGIEQVKLVNKLLFRLGSMYACAVEKDGVKFSIGVDVEAVKKQLIELFDGFVEVTDAEILNIDPNNPETQTLAYCTAFFTNAKTVADEAAKSIEDVYLEDEDRQKLKEMREKRYTAWEKPEKDHVCGLLYESDYGRNLDVCCIPGFDGLSHTGWALVSSGWTTAEDGFGEASNKQKAAIPNSRRSSTEVSVGDPKISASRREAFYTNSITTLSAHLQSISHYPSSSNILKSRTVIMSATSSTGSSIPNVPSTTLETAGACANRLHEVQKSIAILAQLVLEKVVAKDVIKKGQEEVRSFADWAYVMDECPEKAAEEPMTTLKSFHEHAHKGQDALVHSIDKTREQFEDMVLEYEKYIEAFEMFRKQTESALKEDNDSLEDNILEIMRFIPVITAPFTIIEFVTNNAAKRKGPKSNEWPYYLSTAFAMCT
ncbi:hypothetical protein QBC45DRAFT_435202 [Copromyces sp. CBS 386.78]|nr:hypothetical protein QBC45DRAFT_435202 [Copromyces sp. CBS 386.78]